MYKIEFCLFFVVFELVQIEYGSKEHAKAVFYQAIQQCPWSKVKIRNVFFSNQSIHFVSFIIKAIYFDGGQCFPEEIEKIVEIMEEKELRIRTPLEEIKLLKEINQK